MEGSLANRLHRRRMFEALCSIEQPSQLNSSSLITQTPILTDYHSTQILTNTPVKSSILLPTDDDSLFISPIDRSKTSTHVITDDDFADKDMLHILPKYLEGIQDNLLMSELMANRKNIAPDKQIKESSAPDCAKSAIKSCIISPEESQVLQGETCHTSTSDPSELERDIAPSGENDTSLWTTTEPSLLNFRHESLNYSEGIQSEMNDSLLTEIPELLGLEEVNTSPEEISDISICTTTEPSLRSSSNELSAIIWESYCSSQPIRSKDVDQNTSQKKYVEEIPEDSDLEFFITELTQKNLFINLTSNAQKNNSPSSALQQKLSLFQERFPNEVFRNAICAYTEHLLRSNVEEGDEIVSCVERNLDSYLK